MLTKLTNRIYVSDYDPDVDRPRLAYLHGSRLSVMIDAGNSPSHFQEFIQECKDLGLPEPDFILITHWHWDHVFGLAETRIPAICTNLTQRKLQEMKAWLWDDASMRQRLIQGDDIEFCDVHMRAEYRECSRIKVKTADITFNDELLIECGDLSCVIRRCDNDHAQDACILYVPEEKVLFLGDIISEDYHHGEPHYTKDKLNALTKTLLSYDFDLAIHSHTEFFDRQSLSAFLEEAKTLIKEAK